MIFTFESPSLPPYLVHCIQVYHDYKTNPASPEYAQVDATKFGNLTGDQETAQSEEIAKYFMQSAAEKYTSMVGGAAEVGVQIGNMYTASLYGGLLGLLSHASDTALVGKRVLLFSYGSGIAASLFVLRITKSVQAMREAADLDGMLSSRTQVTPALFTEMLSLRELLHGNHSVKATWDTSLIRKESYHLDEIDEKFRRKYLQKE